MAHFLTIDELLDRVSELTQNLTVADARVAQRFTERNVRYYVTEGYVRPPLRHKGKSVWTEDHVKDLVRIRRAQSAGQPLKAIGAPEIVDTTPSWKLANLGVHRSQLAHTFETPLLQDAGWALQISQNIQLTGFTSRRPTQQEIQRVTQALASLITSDINDKDQQ